MRSSYDRTALFSFRLKAHCRRLCLEVAARLRCPGGPAGHCRVRSERKRHRGPVKRGGRHRPERRARASSGGAHAAVAIAQAACSRIGRCGAEGEHSAVGVSGKAHRAARRESQGPRSRTLPRQSERGYSNGSAVEYSRSGGVRANSFAGAVDTRLRCPFMWMAQVELRGRGPRPAARGRYAGARSC